MLRRPDPDIGADHQASPLFGFLPLGFVNPGLDTLDRRIGSVLEAEQLAFVQPPFGDQDYTNIDGIFMVTDTL